MFICSPQIGTSSANAFSVACVSARAIKDRMENNHAKNHDEDHENQSLDDSEAPFDLIITGGTCVLPSQNGTGGLVLGQVDIGVHAQKIVAIKPVGQLPKSRIDSATMQIDATHLHVLPGAIDTQVHFREPGLTHKEDLESGTRGAVIGGVTSVFEMPNTKPPTTTREALQDKLDHAQNRCWSHYAFFVGATPENISTLNELEVLPGSCGVKVFMGSSTGTLLVAEEENLRQIMRNGRRRMAVHAEDEMRLNERKQLFAGQADVRLHPQWRDEETALRATQRLVKLAIETGRATHILHVTTAEEMKLLREKQVPNMTAEVTPNHLTLIAPECYERLGSLAQMNPPVRERRHYEALWAAINDRTVTVVGSDHAPHTLDEKANPWPQSPSGMTGVQTILPLMLHHSNEGRLSLERVVELLAREPAHIYGIRGKGEIKIGFDADFAIVDLKAKQTITNQWITSRVGWTPFDGMKISAWVKKTILGGQLIYDDGSLLGQPQGCVLDFSIS